MEKQSRQFLKRNLRCCVCSPRKWKLVLYALLHIDAQIPVDVTHIIAMYAHTPARLCPCGRHAARSACHRCAHCCSDLRCRRHHLCANCGNYAHRCGCDEFSLLSDCCGRRYDHCRHHHSIYLTSSDEDDSYASSSDWDKPHYDAFALMGLVD